ncbi:MAG: ATP-binding protein [Motiliproteus sp.]
MLTNLRYKAAVLTATLITVFLAPNSFAEEVLVLHSYHPGYRWTDDVQSGINSVFKDRIPSISQDIQYLDTKRHSDPSYYQKLLDLLANKYQNKKFDLIITSDDNAFNFILKHRDRLFPDVPVVFCGVNYFEPSRIEGLNNITGINEEADIKQGMLFALSQHPKVKKMLVITDTTTTGRKVRNTLDRVIPQLPKHVRYEILDNITFNNLIDTSNAADKDDIIFLTLFLRDSEGRYFEYNEVPEAILENSKAPVYATWDFNLGQGVVGGLLTSGHFQGRAAADYSLRILAGEKSLDIPPLLNSPNRYMFDYLALKKWGMSVDQLPADSIIINQPDDFYQKYATQLWFIGLTILFLLVLVSGQRIHISRQKGIERELKSSKQTLQGIFDGSYQFIALLDTSGVLLKTNRTSVDFMGVSEADVIGQYLWDTPLWDTSEKSKDQLKNAVKQVANGNTTRFEVKLKNQVQQEVIMDFSIQPLIDEHGKVHMLIPEGRDISSLKRAEHKLLQLNEELEERVHSRTIDLEKSNSDLKEILDTLKATQKQLVASEKMAALGGLVAGVAHEINTPLGVSVTAASHLEGAVNTLFDKYDNEQLRRNDFDEARSDMSESCSILKMNLERSAELVNSFKKIAVDQTSEEQRSFDCRSYIAETLLALKAELRKHQHRITVDCPEGLTIQGYPGLFSQILTNLIINSINHAFAPEQEGNILITITPAGDDFILEYEDDGIGLSQQALDKLFDPFFTTRRSSGNAGLGAFIVFNVCTQVLNGSVDCSSEPGQGLHYRIRLPLVQVQH